MARKTKKMEEKKPSELAGSESLCDDIDVNSSDVNSSTKPLINQEVSNSDENENEDKARTRNFAFLVYPESAKPGWVDILHSFHVEGFISPLHKDDKNPDGTPKKEHYHVEIMFSSVKTWKQAKEIRDAVGGVGRENVASARGYARYLCHLDNPEKAQYDPKDIIELGGADYQEVIRRSADTVRLLSDMMDYIADNNILFYSDFVDYCRAEKPEWFEAIVTRYTYPVYTYIKARSKKAEIAQRVLVTTGEIIE